MGTGSRFRWVTVAATVAVGIAATVGADAPRGAWVYADGPPPGHTGGFDEPTCHACHFDQPVNAEGGWLTVEGVPPRYWSGAVYPITIVLTRPGLGRGGFQLAARFIEGGAAGRQAGSWRLPPSGMQIASADDSLVQYVEHTREGTALTAPDTVRWEVAWQAPAERGGMVVFHLGANAANDDASEFGDYIYLKRLFAAGGE